MTPKQRYDERKRLKAARLLHEERQAAAERDRDAETDARLERLIVSFERIADVLELWADQQV